MSENNRTRRVQPFVAIGVVKVPMRVDEVLDRVGADGCKRVGDLGTGAGKASIDKELTVATGKHGDISSSAHQDAHVAAEFLHGDSSGCGCFPGCLHEPIILSE